MTCTKILLSVNTRVIHLIHHKTALSSDDLFFFFWSLLIKFTLSHRPCHWTYLYPMFYICEKAAKISNDIHGCGTEMFCVWKETSECPYGDWTYDLFLSLQLRNGGPHCNIAFLEEEIVMCSSCMLWRLNHTHLKHRKRENSNKKVDDNLDEQ